MRGVVAVGLAVFGGFLCAAGDHPPSPSSPYARWLRAPYGDPGLFPLAVWLQSPANAQRYREAGFNTYVGLWHGPTEAQLSELKKAGMRLICEQNEVALHHLEDDTIVGWMHQDEPDNAQSLGAKGGWGPPVSPEAVVTNYHRLRAKDSSRPVLLNLGQGVAWDEWYGRGSRSNHPEDYPRYLEGCDIASFDIYPAVHDRVEIAGKLWFVARGVERLVQWSAGRQIVWNCLECTRISNPDRKPTPREVRCEAWMSLIHGSRGLIFFVHQFKPVFREAALLDDPEMLQAVTDLNREITRLAPVLNSPALTGSLAVTVEDSTKPVAAAARFHDGVIYVFAVGMRDRASEATFTLNGIEGGTKVQVLGENRSLAISNGVFKDRFEPWGVHFYRVGP